MVRSRGDFQSAKSWMMDLFAISVVASVIIFFSWGAGNLDIPASDLTYQKITLEMSNIPYYALQTTFRMLIAIVIALIFSLIYATLAAKSKHMEEILVPFLDILQSVPVLGYISFTVSAFIAFAPNTVLGLEIAVIFAIFTSQVWNLTFSIYQSMKSIPLELEEAAIAFKMNKWQKFWRVEVPYCIPNMIWNMTVSMAGGWFFVVASESICVGTNTITRECSLKDRRA
jgi:NitT/TauT family transport system permease protein